MCFRPGNMRHRARAAAWPAPQAGHREPEGTRAVMTPVSDSGDNGKAAYRLRARGRPYQPRARMRWCGCGTVAGEPAVVRVEDYADGSRRAWWRRVKLCQRPGCPVCARRKAAIHRGQAEAAIRARGGVWTLATLTVPHDRSESARDVLGRLHAAVRSWRSRRAVRAVFDARVDATIRATEVTRGANGWHWHVHILMAADARDWEASELAAIAQAWCGVSGAVAGVGFVLSDPMDCDSAEGIGRAAAYVAKAGSEIAGIAKDGAKRSVWRLLERAARGDRDAARLWADFDAALHGRRLFELDERAAALAELGALEEGEAVRSWELEVDAELYRGLAALERRAAMDPRAPRVWLTGTHEAIAIAGTRAGDDPTAAIEEWLLDSWKEAREAGALRAEAQARMAEQLAALAARSRIPSMAELAGRGRGPPGSWPVAPAAAAE